MDVYVGSIFSFAFGFAPADSNQWMQCNGQMLSINQYQVLFALIGTTYGGNGSTTFGIPNLQGCVPFGYGQGTGLSNYVLGQSAGNLQASLTIANLPPHTHAVSNAATLQIPVSSNNNDASGPAGAYFGMADASTIGNAYASSGTGLSASSVSATSATGGSAPVDITNPYQVVNYCIAVLGIYPTRN